MGQLPDAIRKRQLVEERLYVKVWRDVFREAVDSGELRSDLNPDLVQLLIIGILNWATEWWSPKRGSLDEVVRSAQAIVRRGISA